MTKFIMMVGLVGSGKSTRAQELAKEYNGEVFSSDALREEMFGNVNHQTDNTKLFEELHRRIKECLKEGKSAIYDATNISYKRRMAFLAELKNMPCEKICVLMATPYEECLKRNTERERKVPEHVITKMYVGFDVPYWYEGWDNIEIVYATINNAISSFRWFATPNEWIEHVYDFNQDNPHHTLTLGNHCLEAFASIAGTYDVLNEDDPNDNNYLYVAAKLHDFGKTKCKSFMNSKGEATSIAHYYNHERVGSYDSLFCNYTADPLDVAILIRWHMQPYFWEKDNNERSHNKYKNLWGDDLYNDIMKLHEADLAAH